MEVSSGHFEATDNVFTGGKSVQTMGISASAEFYQLLSSALYSHPLLSAIREVLCNAHDANIANGKADTPIEITFSEADEIYQMTVKDSGKGIPHDEFLEIYGTYGNSTKRKSEAETGGFGLGTKAPFAITGHMNVINCYDGIKKIYKILKEGANEEGKPDIVEMASMPTEESGVTVTIPFRTYSDYHQAMKNTQALVYTGCIPATIDGTLSDVLPLNKSEESFLMMPNTPRRVEIIANYLGDHQIWVKYGAVLYPLNITPFGRKSSVNGMASQLAGATMFFELPANSVRVSPNRESLQYTPSTMEAIEEVAKGIYNRLAHLKKVGKSKNLKSIVKDHTLTDGYKHIIQQIYRHNEDTPESLLTAKDISEYLQRTSVDYHNVGKVYLQHNLKLKVSDDLDLKTTFNNYLLKNTVRVLGDQIRSSKLIIVRRNSVDNSPYRPNESPFMVFGYSSTLTSAVASDSTIRSKLRNISGSIWTMAIPVRYVRITKANRDLIPGMVKKAKALGFTVFELPKPEPRTSSTTYKKPNTKGHGFLNITQATSSSYNIMVGLNPIQVPNHEIKDYVFVSMRRSGQGSETFSVPEAYLPKQVSMIAKLTGKKLIYILGTNEERHFEKHGAVDLKTALLDIREEFIKNDENVTYALWSINNHYNGFDYRGDDTNQLVRLFLYQPKLLKTLVEAKLSKPLTSKTNYYLYGSLLGWVDTNFSKASPKACEDLVTYIDTHYTTPLSKYGAFSNLGKLYDKLSDLTNNFTEPPSDKVKTIIRAIVKLIKTNFKLRKEIQNALD